MSVQTATAWDGVAYKIHWVEARGASGAIAAVRLDVDGVPGEYLHTFRQARQAAQDHSDARWKAIPKVSPSARNIASMAHQNAQAWTAQENAQAAQAGMPIEKPQPPRLTWRTYP